MARIEFQLNIQSPIEKVYEASQDYSVRYHWDPFPENIVLLHGATNIQKGVQVLVVAKNGLKMEVKFVQVLSPTTAVITMTKGPFFLKSFSGSWIFKSLSVRETNARFVYSIKTKWWALPWFSEFIAGWYFSKVIKARLSGLKIYCEANI
ncbi:MAG: SRPBCC family protein [Pseudomonadota bacterium]